MICTIMINIIIKQQWAFYLNFRILSYFQSELIHLVYRGNHRSMCYNPFKIIHLSIIQNYIHIQNNLLYIQFILLRVYSQNLMTTLLGKYKYIRKLGKGAYGDVVLVEDSEGKNFAIKIISKKILQKDSFMIDYLEGEKECMMNVKHKYIMGLLETEEDYDNIYFICEYCDGGDLLNYQAKQPNKVFELNTAAKLLSEVILGLEVLHTEGYLHRDIKPQNILLKKSQKDGEYHCKLADFGFAKKSVDADGTVLGTQNYMSPEIFQQQSYGYEVDMWAFGVVFYFMLNLELPFKTNPHQKQLGSKRENLMKQAKGFVYSEAVAKSNRKIKDNCTKNMDDLFSKIFQLDPRKRINFSDIRKHPIFSPYFVKDYESKIYSKAFEDKRDMLKVKKSKISKEDQTKQEDNIQPSFVKRKEKAQEFDKQLDFIQLEHEKINFLALSEEQAIMTNSVLNSDQILMLRYCLWKYYIILLRNFIHNLNPEHLSKKANLKWKQFIKSQIFKKKNNEFKDEFAQAELKLTQIHDCCVLRVNQINKLNQKFGSILEREVSEKAFEGNFKQAYRSSTGYAYSKLRKVFKQGNKIVYLTAIVTLCHAFNKLMEEDDAQLYKIFDVYIDCSSTKGKKIDYNELRSWMSCQKKDNIIPIIKNTFNVYFSG